jgi:hypothetical protein
MNSHLVLSWMQSCFGHMKISDFTSWQIKLFSFFVFFWFKSNNFSPSDSNCYFVLKKSENNFLDNKEIKVEKKKRIKAPIYWNRCQELIMDHFWQKYSVPLKMDYICLSYLCISCTSFLLLLKCYIICF